MSFIKFCFEMFLFALAVGAFVSIVIFAIDVIKWHDKETKVKIIPSNNPEPEENEPESEVNDNVRNDGECNTSTFSIPWGES